MSDWDKIAADAAIEYAKPTTRPVQTMSDHMADAFHEGARWQREALLSDESVERAARVLFERDQIRLEQRGYFKVEWADSKIMSGWDEYVKPWRDEARAALTVALEGEQ